MLEKELSEIWASRRIGGVLRTLGGEEVTVVYPGRINDGRGGDFCDAVIALGGRTVRGDVELHVRSGDWKGHGHDRDPSYNRVVLHVVHSITEGAATVLQDGREVPELALAEFMEQPAAGGGVVCWRGCGGGPCHDALPRLGEAAVAAVIEQAGDVRFEDKTSRFQASLDAGHEAQPLYAGMMAALGYAKNQTPFAELARRVSLADLEPVMRAAESDRACEERIESLLLGVAGLGWVAPGRDSMAASDWAMFRARPNNSPQSRIAAMSQILVRHRREGLVAGILTAFQAAATAGDHRCLESVLMSGSTAGGVSGLGRDRAADIGVNVLLPFLRALGDRRREPGLSTGAVSLYRGWPRLGSNCVERHMMGQIGLGKGVVNSARRQQGLMEIYAKRCVHGGCVTCGLGQPEAGYDVQIEAGALPGEEPEIAGRGDHGGVVGTHPDGRDEHGYR
jgi:hypothetical protein